MVAKEMGLDIITWTFERNGPLSVNLGYYYYSLTDVIEKDADKFELLRVLDEDVGILGIFSDWPGTTTFYANCMKRDLR